MIGIPGKGLIAYSFGDGFSGRIPYSIYGVPYDQVMEHIRTLARLRGTFIQSIDII